MAEEHRHRLSIHGLRLLSPHIIVASFTAVVVLLGAYTFLVAPLQKKVMGQEVLGLAQDLDAGVKARSAALEVAQRDMGLERLLDTRVLENLLKTVRSRFPDLLGVDVIQDDGTILAMVGELPMSDAGLFRIVDTSRFGRADSSASTWGWVFSDDPSGNCFHMMRMSVGADNRRWFTRARFAREWVSETMARFSADSGLRAALIPVAVESRTPSTDATAVGWRGPAGGASVPVVHIAVSGSWWTGPSMAEAYLRFPGWLVRVEKNAGFPAGLVLASSLIVFGLMVTGFRFRSRAFAMKDRLGNLFPDRTSQSGQLAALARSDDRDRSTQSGKPTETIVRTPSQETTDDVFPEAVFLAPADDDLGKEVGDTSRGAAPLLVNKQGGNSYTRALEWFEPELDEEPAEPTMTRSGPAHPAARPVPEYIDVEWTEQPGTSSDNRLEHMETEARVPARGSGAKA